MENPEPGLAIVGQPGELRIGLTITRAATGKVETAELVGCADRAQLIAAGLIPPTEPQEQSHV